MKLRVHSYNHIYISESIKLTYDVKQNSSIHTIYYSSKNTKDYFALNRQTYHNNHKKNFYLFWLKNETKN